MHWIEVDGFPMPKRIGGHPALDLCNTWAGWGEPWSEKREWLPDYERAAVWSGFAELLPRETVVRLRRRARLDKKQAGRVVTQLHDFRDCLYRVLTEDDPRAFRSVSVVCQRALVSSRLIDEGGMAARVLPSSIGLELPLLAAARAAEDLLNSEARRTIRRCPGNDCGWLFLDPRGRRKWCDMTTCGNRAKARAYLERSRSK